MKFPASVLDALPLDPTPDSGPVHRGGPFTYFVALSCGLTALGGALLLEQQGRRLWGGLALLALGAVAARAVWCLVDRFRHRCSLPRSHAVLTDGLGFRIHCTCRDVAATVFFDPDALTPGAGTRLLCFLENYASRQRIACLHIGPHPRLGLAEPLHVSLRLAAGQAAVYVVPLAVAPSLPAGEHDIPVMLRVRKPTGTGVRLPNTRRHVYDLWTVHLAVPFTVAAPTGATASTPVVAPRPDRAQFISLASISEPAARLDAIQSAVSAGFPAERA